MLTVGRCNQVEKPRMCVRGCKRSVMWLTWECEHKQWAWVMLLLFRAQRRTCIVMAAHSNGPAIIMFCRCGFFLSPSFFFFFYPRLFSPVADWMSIMMWPWCEFRMQVWSVLHAARWNIGRKNSFFFPTVDSCLSCEDIARQICGMVSRWRFFGEFYDPAFPASRVQHISDLHSKFALRPHHVWKYGRHPISDGWD